MKVKNESEVAQLCWTLRDPTDCSLPGSSIHGSLQARVLEWVAISLSKKGPLWLVLICSLVCQANYTDSLAGIHFYCSVHQTLKVLLSLVPFSIVQRPELVFEEREATVMAPSLMCDSAILPCLRGCLAFLRRHFPPQSPPSCSLGPSPCRQQQTSP